MSVYTQYTVTLWDNRKCTSFIDHCQGIDSFSLQVIVQLVPGWREAVEIKYLAQGHSNLSCLATNLRLSASGIRRRTKSLAICQPNDSVPPAHAAGGPWEKSWPNIWPSASQTTAFRRRMLPADRERKAGQISGWAPAEHWRKPAIRQLMPPADRRRKSGQISGRQPAYHAGVPPASTPVSRRRSTDSLLSGILIIIYSLIVIERFTNPGETNLNRASN